MKDSVATSELLKHRANHCVPKRADECEEAILNRDFQKFAEITMKDSNQFHAVCLDTYPPISYMSDVSHYLVRLIHSFNEAFGEIKAAYTFDAGQNACLFVLKQNLPLVVGLIEHYLPQKISVENDFFRGEKVEPVNLPREIIESINITPHQPGVLKGIIHSKVGNGPELLSNTDHLLNEDGLPKRTG